MDEVDVAEPQRETNTYHETGETKVVVKMRAIPDNVTELPPDPIDVATLVYDASSAGHWLTLLELQVGSFRESQTVAMVVAVRDLVGDVAADTGLEEGLRHFAEPRGLPFSLISHPAELTDVYCALLANSLNIKRNELGRGGQGSVVPGLLGNGVRVAVKVINASGYEEVRLLKRCQGHPHIIRLFAVNDESNKIENTTDVARSPSNSKTARGTHL